MKKEIIEKINALLDQEFSKEIMTEVKQLIADFNQQRDMEHKAQMEVFLADEENDKNDFMPHSDELDEVFNELTERFNLARKKYAEQRAAVERENLKTKLDIIDGISHITAHEENISKAFAEFNAYREKWNQTGRVPGDRHQEVTSAYHAAVDQFYYHIRIYKDLKDFDLKKNLDHKKEILDKIEAISSKSNVKELEESIRALQSEWFECGPVPRDSYEELKALFNEKCDAIYARIKEHYNQLKEQLQENLKKKQSLLDRAVNVNQSKADTHKAWQLATEKIIKLQEEWKTIGFGPKKENEEIWQEFRKQCDLFFSAKKAYYDVLHRDFEINRLKKEELCEKAEALQSSNQWKDTADKLVKLQQQWKNIGPAGQKFEQKLWLRFRGACNVFFENKKNFFSAQDDKLSEHLEQKEALLKKFESLEFTDDKDANLQLIKTFTKEWSAVGHVPRKDMERINQAFNKLMDDTFDKLGIDKDELEHSKFIQKVQSYLNSEDFAYLLNKERRFLDDKIRELEHQVIQYENNLGFFANSKGADKMLKDVMANLNKAKSNIKRIEDQKKIMSRMLREKEKTMNEAQ